jgi:hypothetical protein
VELFKFPEAGSQRLPPCNFSHRTNNLQVIYSQATVPQPVKPHLANIGRDVQDKILSYLTVNNPEAYEDMVCLSLTSKAIARGVLKNGDFKDSYAKAQSHVWRTICIRHASRLIMVPPSQFDLGFEIMSFYDDCLAFWRQDKVHRLADWKHAVQSRYNTRKIVEALKELKARKALVNIE